MRIERILPPNVDTKTARTPATAKVQDQISDRRDEFASTTGDLLALFSATASSSTPRTDRQAIVADLKSAYQRGAIQPDASRIAAAMLRFHRAES